jgi:hypothetical protein
VGGSACAQTRKPNIGAITSAPTRKLVFFHCDLRCNITNRSCDSMFPRDYFILRILGLH